MTETQQATASQEEAAGQVQETTEQTEATTEEAVEATEETPAKTYDEDYVKGLRKEAASYRTRLANAEKRVKMLEEGQDADTSAVREENETLKTENESLRDLVRRSAFIEAIDLPNPRAAWAMARDMRMEIEWDENHRPTNLDATRKALREADPGLFGEGSADGGATTRTKNGYEGPAGVGRMRNAYEQKQKE